MLQSTNTHAAIHLFIHSQDENRRSVRMSSCSFFSFLFYTRYNPSHFMLTIGGREKSGGKPLFCRRKEREKKRSFISSTHPHTHSFCCCQLSPYVQTDKQMSWRERHTMRSLSPSRRSAPGDVWIVGFILASAMIGAPLLQFGC